MIVAILESGFGNLNILKAFQRERERGRERERERENKIIQIYVSEHAAKNGSLFSIHPSIYTLPPSLLSLHSLILSPEQARRLLRS